MQSSTAQTAKSTYKRKFLRTLKSPNFFASLRHGILYQLTPLYQQRIGLPAVMLSVCDYTEMRDVLLKLQEQKRLTLKQFFGLPEETVTYLSPVAYHKALPSEGTSKKNSIRIPTIRGNSEISADEYNQMAKLLQADIVVQLAEVTSSSGQGSARRSLEKAQLFMRKLLDDPELSEKRTACSRLASITGGAHEELRKLATENALKFSGIDGLVLHGFGITGALGEEHRDLLPLVLSGNGDPLEVLHGLANGVDFFECEFPFRLAQNGLAWHYTAPPSAEELRVQYTEGALSAEEFRYGEVQDTRLDLNVWSAEWRTEPVKQGCECSACKEHTRAYIAHLLACHEMTANVLLTIHNYHTYRQFFLHLGDAADNGTLNQYIRFYIDKNTEPISIALQEQRKIQEQQVVLAKDSAPKALDITE